MCAHSCALLPNLRAYPCASQAGDTSFDGSKFALPVFTVSSLEYQKLAGLRPNDGEAQVLGAENFVESVHKRL